MPNGIATGLILCTATPLLAQVAIDDKLINTLVQFPAVLVVVWLLVQQAKDRSRRDAEQTALVREVVAAVTNSVKAVDNSTIAINHSAEALGNNTTVIYEMKNDLAGMRESLAHQHSVIEKLRTEADHRAALHHTQRIEGIPA